MIEELPKSNNQQLETGETIDLALLKKASELEVNITSVYQEIERLGGAERVKKMLEAPGAISNSRFYNGNTGEQTIARERSKAGNASGNYEVSVFMTKMALTLTALSEVVSLATEQQETFSSLLRNYEEGGVAVASTMVLMNVLPALSAFINKCKERIHKRKANTELIKAKVVGASINPNLAG